MIVSFGGLTFDARRPVSGYTQSMSLSTEAQDQDAGKPATLIKGAELEQQQFTVRLLRPMGVSPEGEIALYRKTLEAANPQRLVVGGRVMGSCQWLLKSVSVKETTLDGRGRMVAASVELSFEEFVRAGVKTASTGGSAAPGIADAGLTANDAYKVGWPSVGGKAGKTRG